MDGGMAGLMMVRKKGSKGAAAIDWKMKVCAKAQARQTRTAAASKAPAPPRTARTDWR